VNFCIVATIFSRRRVFYFWKPQFWTFDNHQGDLSLFLIPTSLHSSRYHTPYWNLSHVYIYYMFMLVFVRRNIRSWWSLNHKLLGTFGVLGKIFTFLLKFKKVNQIGTSTTNLHLGIFLCKILQNSQGQMKISICES
jgi:hypothetical protein